MEKSSLEQAERLLEAAEKAEAIRQQTTRGLSAVLKRVHAKHIFALEALISRYQDDLEKIARGNKHPVDMVRALSSAADKYIPQAVAMGFARGLSDLRGNGWITGIKGSPQAPPSVVQSITLENERYLTTSLLPALQTGTSDAAKIARIRMYGHYLWKAAERGTVAAITEFQAFYKAQNRKDKVREGGATSGNYGHAGRPGERGGSTPGSGRAAKAKPGTHVGKVSEAPGFHTFNFPSGGYLNYSGFPTDTRIKNTILSEIDKNVEKVPGQPQQIDEVFLSNMMELEYNGKVESLNTTVGVTLTGFPDKNVVGFNSTNIAYHICQDNGFSIADRLGTSTTAYARAVVDHEMGHVLYKQMGSGSKVEWQARWSKNYQNFTKYAGTSSSEGFAEAYAAYVNGSSMPQDYRDYMDRTLDHHTLKEAESSDDEPIAYICGFSDGPTLHIYKDRVEHICDPTKRIPVREGGAGSGNWDHAGRPGERGGSAASSDLKAHLRKIAAIYSNASHDPTNPATQKAYAAFIKETLDQYHDLKAAGYKFDFEDKGEPYKDQPDMRRSVGETKTLFVRSSKDDLPDDSPLAKVVEDGQTANTIFRGVHDMYGHFFPDNTFGERGEFKAYQAHGRMYSKDALPALAAETLAQNAWLNHSPENESKPVSQRTFPDQKSFAFPVEIADQMRHGYFPEYQNHRKREAIREGGVGSGNYGHVGRAGMRGGSSSAGSSLIPSIVARALQRDGGITISTSGVRPRSGFAVAGIKDKDGNRVERIFDTTKIDNTTIEKFVNENHAILSQPGHFIGGWVNEGKTYLDVSEVLDDKSKALDAAEARDEKAVYDLSNYEEHFTREDHLRPSESNAGRAA
jgi:hypothetical protein